MAAHFGQMLQERRRARGLSIQQVANVIKIRPQIIEYFETENFAAMPPRGYAQGMISSYARYLGLNPRQVVEVYFDNLSAYERGAGVTTRRGAGRLQDSATDPSPRSSNATGRFMIVDSAPVSSRYAQRPPQAGYVSEGTSLHEPLSASQLRPLPMVGRGGASRGAGDMRQAGQGSRQDMGRTQVRRANGTRGGEYRPRTLDGRDRGQRAGDPYGQDRDLAYRDGRRGSASQARGNGNRNGSGSRRGQGGGVPPRRGNGQGRGGHGNAPRGGGQQTDPRLFIALGAAVLVIIILLAVLLLRGCAPAQQTDTGGSSTPQTTVNTGSADTGDGADTDAGDSSDGSDSSDNQDGTNSTDGSQADGQDGSDAQDGTDGATEPEETKVKVSLKGKGTVAWIEVKLDGKSVLAEEQVGPFEQEFTVTQQIEITTDHPSDVTVTKNGEKVRYDTKVSGVAKVTITAPKKDDAAANGTDTGDGAATDGQDASGDARDGTSGQTQQ